MQNKILKLGLATFVIIGWLVILFQYPNDVETQTSNILVHPDQVDISFLHYITSKITDGSGRNGVPLRLKIPSIGLDTSLEQVGLTSDGALDVPVVPTHAAWYKNGARPGNAGTAVIDGHVNWKHGITAVFVNLRKVKVGDTIVTEDETDRGTAFIVRAIRSYDFDADVKEVFISSDKKAHLNIITCAGVWDKVAKNYSKRLVVFAEGEGSGTSRI